MVQNFAETVDPEPFPQSKTLRPAVGPNFGIPSSASVELLRS